MEKKHTKRNFVKRIAFIGGGALLTYAGYRTISHVYEKIQSNPRFFSSNSSIAPLLEINPVSDAETKIEAYKLLHERISLDHINGETYTYLQPSEKYPRYWYWDNMLGATAASFLDPAIAREVLITQASIFDNLGVHGPQIIYFNHSKVSFEQQLFKKVRGGEKGIDQLTQTPLAGFALEIYAQKTGDLKTVEKLLPSFEKHYEYLKNNRYLDNGINLPITINPYESLDAQPSVDLMYKIDCDDPGVFTILSTATLVHARSNNFDAKLISKKGGYAMYDVAFCSFYIKSLFSLANLCQAIGNTQKADYWWQEAEKSQRDLITNCFDVENGYFYNKRANKSGELLKVDTAAGLFPLLNTLPENIVQQLIKRMIEKNELETNKYYLPFVFKSEKKYDDEKVLPLWRGPGNSVVDFVTVYGLLQNGQVELAEKMYNSQQYRLFERMLSNHAFPEFYTKNTAFRDSYLWSTLSACNPFELFETAKN